jgi:hypothetical protein
VATKNDLPGWLTEALLELGGRASLVQLTRRIWKNHEEDLRASGDLFFTWQYDLRWAANKLRRSFVMKEAGDSPKGIWELR